MPNTRPAIRLSGTLPSQEIQELIEAGAIGRRDGGIPASQVQPASLDLTLTSEAYQLPGSVLPLRSEGVRDVVEALQRRRIDLSKPTLLDRNKVYLIRLAESFDLPANVGAYCNNKSSTGRIDLATRTVSDRNPRYDKVAEGYRGELWLEVIPKSFDVILSEGVSLNQVIFYAERTILRSGELENFYSTPVEDGEFMAGGRVGPLLYDKLGVGIPRDDVLIEDGLLMTLDLEQDVIGYVARKTYEPIDLSKIGLHDPKEFFDPIPRPKHGRLWLERGRFYIFSTWEYVRVPPAFAVEMLPYDTSAGEFRAHYAGFFDPGFGYGLKGEEKGTPAVLEVRAYEDDLIIRHRQPICRMAYEPLSDVPSKLYHASIGSTYATQRGPRLSKYFGPEAK